MKKMDCPYCSKNVSKFGYLAWENETSEFIVFKDQSHQGRMIVAYKNDHIAEIKDVTEEDRNKFMKDVADCANAIQKTYQPDRINYGFYGDTLGHLHCHIVPKYKDGFEWGGTFVMNTGNLVSEEECDKVAEEVKKNFKA